MDLILNEPIDLTAAQVAEAEGKTKSHTSNRWELEAVTTPPGLTVTAAKITGTPTEAGAFSVTLYELDSYYREVAVYTVALTVTDPSAPDPEPEPEVPEEPVTEPTSLDALAAEAVEYIGRPVATAGGLPSRHLKTAQAQVRHVLEFVRGYTKDRGFAEWDEAGVLPSSLRTVIVSALSRLVQNPEQVATFTAGDYSERGAVFAGFTLHERAVLNRYRPRTNVGAVTTTYAQQAPAGGGTYATETYVNTAIANGQPDLTPYALRSELPESVDLDPYALRSEIPAPVDLSPYVTDGELTAALDALPEPEPVDLTGYATETYVDDAVAAIPEPDLSGYVTAAEVPALVGLKRSASYTLTQDTVVKVYDVVASGSVFVMANGDKSPGPLWIQIYRSGIYNSVDKWAGSNNWTVGGTSDPNAYGFSVWVDGQGSNAALCFKATNNWSRKIRVYWMEV